MNAHKVWVQGIGVWTQQWPNWEAARQFLRGHSQAPALNPAFSIPTPSLLTTAERRRATQTVALALEVGQQAMQMAQADYLQTCSVFVSSRGDTPIVDYLCQTLAQDPFMTSPTRFIHSIHNAAAGAWNIATASIQQHTAMAAGEFSLANGLLQAMVQCLSTQQTVLLVNYDAQAPLALCPSATQESAQAVALVISAQPSSRALGVLHLTLYDHHAEANNTTDSAECGFLSASTLLLQSQDLLRTLALELSSNWLMPLSPHQSLSIHYSPETTTHL